VRIGWDGLPTGGTAPRLGGTDCPSHRGADGRADACSEAEKGRVLAQLPADGTWNAPGTRGEGEVSSAEHFKEGNRRARGIIRKSVSLQRCEKCVLARQMRFPVHRQSNESDDCPRMTLSSLTAQTSAYHRSGSYK
jgi:hypothetical protein